MFLAFLLGLVFLLLVKFCGYVTFVNELLANKKCTTFCFCLVTIGIACFTVSAISTIFLLGTETQLEIPRILYPD